MRNDTGRKWMYDKLTRGGYNLGTYEEYDNHADEPEARRWLYDKGIEMGLNLGSYEDFDKGMGYKNDIPSPTLPSPNGETENHEKVLSIMGTKGMQLADDVFIDHKVRPKFKPKEVKSVADIQENYMNRFLFSDEGSKLQKEYSQAQTDIGKELMNEYLKSPEYKELSSRLKGKELDDAANKDFQTRYGEELQQRLQPYEAKITTALNNRYGQQMNDEYMNLTKNNNKLQAADLQTRLDAQKDKIKEETAQQYAGNRRLSDDQYREIAKKNRTLDAAYDLIKESNQIIEEAGNKGNTSFVGGFLRGLKNGVFDLDTWTWGITDLQHGREMLAVLEKVDKGEPLTEEEQLLSDAILNNVGIQMFFSSDLGRGYKAGQTTGMSLPFMLDMLIGMGAVQGVTKGASRAILKLATQKARQLGMKQLGTNIMRGAARTVSGIGDAALHTATFGEGRLWADYTDRKIGDVQVKPDENGNLTYAGRENIQTGAEALGKAFISTAAETGSELAGQYFAPMLGFVGKLTGANKIGKLIPGRHQGYEWECLECDEDFTCNEI